MKIAEFVDAYKTKKFMNTKQGVEERVEWLKKELSVKSYIPFRTKREIADMIVAQYTKNVDGIKKYDSIDAYVGFVVAMIVAHTSLEFGDDVISDYDLIAENGLLPQIIAEFQESYNESDIVLKMSLAMELEDNNVNVLVGHFLNGILKKLDSVGDAIKEKFEDLDLNELLGADFSKENLAKFSGFLDKLK